MSQTHRRLLAEMVHTALLARDHLQKIDDIDGQPHVWLYVTSARIFNIAIWHAKTFPSESEWITWLRNLPPEILPAGPLPSPQQQRDQHNRYRHMLKASWKLSVPNPFGEHDEETTPAQGHQPTARD